MNKKTIITVLVGLVIGVAGTHIAHATNMHHFAQNTEKSPAVIDHNAQAVDSLKELRGDEFDKAFIKEMITHHEGAIDMAKLIESNAKHDELKQLGKDIISAQTKEIDMMQNWQTEWGYKSAPQSHDMQGM